MSGMTQSAALSALLKTATSLVNAFSTAGWTAIGFGGISNGKLITSGVMVANTLKPVLNLSGSGVLNFFGAYCADGTARTMRIQIVLDGVTVFDSTSASISAGGTGAIPVGVYHSTITMGFPDQLPFKTSCVVNMASNLGETDKFNIYEIHRMT